MVGEWIPVTKKPSRSDEVLDANQQIRIADRVRTHFESVAPKRPAKPNRSEPDSPDDATRDVDSALHGDIPEFQKFQSLLHSQYQVMLSAEGGSVVEDGYVETQYYRELDSIDKQHHTTGSGFIKVVKEVGENGYDLKREDEGGRKIEFSCFRSNPATNDWIPSTGEQQVVHVSSKPNRSESC